MNIIKILLFNLILCFHFLFLNSLSIAEEVETQENEQKLEKKVDLDDEELPAIDPFQSSSAGTSGASADAIPQEEGILNGLRLVGVIIGEKRKIAVMSSKEGLAFNFEENDTINNNVELQEIYSDHLLIKDTFKTESGLTKEKFYEVYMNDIIKSVDG